MARNANFKNPLGLVYRMLRSGNASARSALLHEGLRYLVAPFDLAISTAEMRRIRGAANEATRPLLLVVGPPRSGTTMVYQVLANSLDVSFVRNFSATFSRSPTVAQQFFERWTTGRVERIDNYFGQTSGLGGPNDGFSIWNRWLGSDRYATTPHIDDQSALEMRQFFQSWTSTFAKPFLNKNNRNTHCMQLLAEHLPSAYFVLVNRDPVEIARSLIRAREAVQGSKATGWGLQSQEIHGPQSELGYVDDVCEQIASIRSTIAKQLPNIRTDRVLQLNYREFCTNPQHTINQLLERVPSLERSKRGLTYDPILHPSASKPLSDAEENRIHRLLREQPLERVGEATPSD